MINAKVLDRKGYVWDKSKGGFVLDLKNGNNYILCDLKKYYIKDKQGNSITSECFRNVDEIAKGYLLVKDNYGNIFDIKNSKFVFPSPIGHFSWVDKKHKLFYATTYKEYSICNLDGEILFSSDKDFHWCKIENSDDFICVYRAYEKYRHGYGYLINIKTNKFTKLEGFGRVIGRSKFDGEITEIKFLDSHHDILQVGGRNSYGAYYYCLYDIQTSQSTNAFYKYEWLDDKKTLLKCYRCDHFVLNTKTKKEIISKCSDARLLNENLLDVVDRGWHGVVNANNGEIVLPCVYKKISINKENIIKAKRSISKSEYYTQEGKKIQTKSAKIENTMEQ